MLAGFGVAAMLLIGMGMFVAYKLFSPQNAAQQTVAQNPPSQRESAEPIEAPSKRAATAETAAAASPAKTSPAVANSTIEKRAQQDATDSSPPSTPAPSAGRARQTVQLPAPMQQLVVGGSGNYLVAALPSIKQVAIVDVVAKRIVKLVPIEDSDPALAAGKTKFVVLERGQGMLSRYDLKTGARELTESSDSYSAIAMGSSSEGPILAAGLNTALIDLQTLKPTITKPTDGFRFASISLLASAAGKVFGAYRTNTSPTGIFVFEINGDDFQSAYAHATLRSVIPSADGKTIYSGPMRYDLKCQPFPGQHRPDPGTLLLPAATGAFYMAWSMPGLSTPRSRDRATKGFGAAPPAPPDRPLLTIHCCNDDSPLVAVKDVVLPDFEQDPAARHNPKLPNERRLFWLPIADALVTVPVSCDQLVIQHFNLKEELDNSGIDYFRIASTPPRLLDRGHKLSYAIDVLSKSGNVRYALESGPPGAAVSPDGRLTWEVPADFSPHDALLLVKLTEGSGRELIHAVKLTDGQATPPKSPAIAKATNEQPAPNPTNSSPPTLAGSPRTRQALQLPAPMQQLLVGGSGKYLVAALPSIKKVAVVDVVAKQVVGFIPVDDNDFLVAAGETKVVVLQRTQGIICRYDLKSLKQELAVLCEPYPALAMGSSSEGPLLAIGTKIFAIDLQSLTPTVTKQNVSYQNSSVSAVRMVASATGGVFIIWNTNSTPIAMTVFEVRNGQLELAAAYDVYGAISPSPDGQFIYAAAGREGPGRLDVKCKWIGNDRWAAQALRLPAATGPFCLVVRDYFAQPHPRSLSLTIHTPGDNQPILTVPDVVLPETRLTGAFPTRPMLPPDRCLFWVPIADAIVTVPNGDDQLVIQHFNLKEELEQKGVDYFRVTSVPPRIFQRGQKLSYPIEVFSKQGGVQYTLQNGPPGATVSKDGLVSWNVPADFSPHEAFLLVNLRDGSGQQLAHVIKLTDGQSTPTSQQRTVVERRRVRTPSGRIITTTVSTGVVGPVTSPPKSAGTNVWHWTGGSAVPVRSEKGTFGGIVLGDGLYLLKDNGAMSTEPVKLPATYLHAGLRSSGIIGLAANPTRIEILDRHGKLLRKVPLENVAPTGLALHPTKPICYVGLDRSVPPFRGAFVVVDEQAAKFTAGDEDLGQDVVVDPSGRFLVSTYVHRVHVGDEIVVTGSSRRGSVRGRGRSLGPSGPPPRVGVVHRFAHVAVMLVYDLDYPLLPESHSFNPLPSPPGPMRISYDGRRVTTHVPGGRVANVPACNPLDFKAASIDYTYGAAGGGGLSGSDVAFHPTLPFGAIVAAPTAALFDPDTGNPISTKELLDLPELTNLSVRRAMFSSDGKQLVILATDNKGEHTLLRASLSLSSDQQAALKRRAASPLKSLKSAAPPLAELTAWRGGLSKPTTSAQIAADYSDSVVIVRTENSTGTGFFVGSSGLVLTCAHCVSPMDAVKVVYHSEGKSDEKNTTEATIVYRDRKTDLALLKINVKTPLHPVVLADPIDVKSGEDVTIIANPGMGTEVLDNTVTTGIISNVKRMIAGNPYIQSSAAVNPGSSGGPMFDRSGHVIGVVVLKAGIEGVGFAVPPMSIARFLLKATRHDTKQGLLERAWVDAEMKNEIAGGLMRIEKGSVTLLDKQSGQSKTRPLADFSPGDQKLLALLATDD